MATSIPHGKTFMSGMSYSNPGSKERIGSGKRCVQPGSPHHTASQTHLDVLRPRYEILEPLRRTGSFYCNGSAYRRYQANTFSIQGENLSRQPCPQFMGRV